VKIHITEPCQACEADCQVVHPDWLRYNAQLGQQSSADFFLDLGYLPGEPLPAMVIPCPTCQGTGEVPAWVPVQRFLELLKLTGMGFYKLFGGAPEEV
jgi:hypothetical protein